MYARKQPLILCVLCDCDSERQAATRGIYSYLDICPAVLRSRRAGPGAEPPAPPGRSQRPRASWWGSGRTWCPAPRLCSAVSPPFPGCGTAPRLTETIINYSVYSCVRNIAYKPLRVPALDSNLIALHNSSTWPNFNLPNEFLSNFIWKFS